MTHAPFAAAFRFLLAMMLLTNWYSPSCLISAVSHFRWAGERKVSPDILMNRAT